MSSPVSSNSSVSAIDLAMHDQMVWLARQIEDRLVSLPSQKSALELKLLEGRIVAKEPEKQDQLNKTQEKIKKIAAEALKLNEQLAQYREGNTQKKISELCKANQLTEIPKYLQKFESVFKEYQTMWTEISGLHDEMLDLMGKKTVFIVPQ